MRQNSLERKENYGLKWGTTPILLPFSTLVEIKATETP